MKTRILKQGGRYYPQFRKGWWRDILECTPCDPVEYCGQAKGLDVAVRNTFEEALAVLDSEFGTHNFTGTDEG